MTDIVAKVCALAAFGTLAALLIRRTNPEMGLALQLAVCAAVLFAGARLLEPVTELMREAKALTGLSEAVFAPVVKCIFIALFSRCAADVCRDGGQSALAGTVETVAAIGALYCALPLIATLLDMLGELL
ncbi:MAG: stage III sporulation AC/AD family protein [Oscillospiraceae bacterium]|nr:stage III sporulation AC/AD family protein [Oscillospiraceae bacterium]MCD8374220.1 stage III sporulation AC/AD family protein [Oscillospiraceae bacterium]